MDIGKIDLMRGKKYLNKKILNKIGWVLVVVIIGGFTLRTLVYPRIVNYHYGQAITALFDRADQNGGALRLQQFERTYFLVHPRLINPPADSPESSNEE